MPTKIIKNTEDVLKILCNSVSDVLNKATKSRVTFSPTVQKISRTCLKPDIGCFVVFDGAFSGIIIINITSDAAMEIYHDYLTNMGMSEDELADAHTSDEVGNTLGELMNQIVGDFQGELQYRTGLSINQTQPKMLVLNKEVVMSISANIDRPQSRRVVFSTEKRHNFSLEMSMEKTEFMQLVGAESMENAKMTKDESNQKILDDLDI